MAETTQFVSRISVRDLVSAFESKSDSVKVEFSRPRAKSFGNVLNRDVVVRLNEFTTLEDIEKGLTKLEASLNFYEVYNKAKHVAFQEQFFNILTSIANIENDGEDTPARKKRFISRTQTLVSFLNQKLPTNINQISEPKIPNNAFKYTTYSSYIKENTKNEPSLTKSEANVDENNKPDIYVEKMNTTDATDSGEEYYVSVKKLKQNFQKIEAIPAEQPKQDLEKSSEVQKPKPTLNTQNLDQPKPEIDQTKVVSVNKLRNLFEQKSDEKKGLEIVAIDKLVKNNIGGSAQNVNIPYTESNLRNIRLQRSVSGFSYMNYSGLLNRIDLNRSNSTLNLNTNDDDVEDNTLSDQESDTDSFDTVKSQNEVVKIEEITENYSTPVLDKQDEQGIVKNFVVKYTELIENIKPIDTVKDEYKIEQQNNLPNGKNLEEIEDIDELKEDENKNFSNSRGFHEEEEVTYSETKTVVLKQSQTKSNTQHQLTFKGHEEVEVNSGIAESKNVQTEEDIATFEASTEHISQPLSITNSDDDDRERSLIEEELEKIDVEETLANADIVVDPEDLKKADDEFEKLIENSEKNESFA